jgi:16S rRNA (guanine527-N7)-methyltransferase
VTIQAHLPLGELYVSRETEARLRAFAELVTKWTSHINLIASSTVSVIWDRHIRDSAQLYPLAPEGWSHWADLGSGGGFPGVVLAVMAAERNPAARFTLIESDQRKAAFLRTASHGLDLNLQIICARAETLHPLAAEVLSARALGPLTDLLPLATRHLRPGGRAIFPKGRRATAEIAAAQARWSFSLTAVQSQTDPDASILLIDGVTDA